MDVFHGDLKPVEASSFGDLDLHTESLGEVFQNDPVRGCEKGKHVFDEVLFVRFEFLPV